MSLMLDTARLLISLAFLAVAGVMDWRTRTVENKLWLIFLPIALELLVAEFYPYPWVLAGALTISACVTVAAIGLFYANLYGGADAKAITCLAFALPFELPLIGAALIPMIGIDWAILKRRKPNWQMPLVTYIAVAAAITTAADIII